MIPGVERTHTEIWCPGGFFHLNWFMEQIPPTVRNGMIATVFGNCCTYNLGTRIGIQNAMVLAKGGSQVRRQLAEMLSKAVLAPKTFISEEELTEAIAYWRAQYQKRRLKIRK